MKPEDLQAFEARLAGNSQSDLNEKLWSSAGMNEMECAQLCLNHGASAKSKSGDWKTTPLMRACFNGAAEMARLLIPLSRLNDTDRAGNTAAAHCCEEGEPACLKELIQAGANLDKRNDRGDSPLFIALRLGASSWERTLLAGPTGAGPAELAAKLGPYAACLELLLPACELSQPNQAGATALDVARDGGLTSVAAKISHAQQRTLASAERKILGKIGSKRATAERPATARRSKTL